MLKRRKLPLKINSNKDCRNEFFERTLDFSSFSQEALACPNHCRDDGCRWPTYSGARFCCSTIYLYSVLGLRVCIFWEYQPLP